jgi:transposase
MWYVGLDVHAKRSTYCVLDANGKVVRTHTIKGPWDKVLFELSRIKEPWQVCFEASVGYGVLAERLRKMAQKVLVAHPGQLRLIFRAKRKNDRVDAAKLAKLLFLDEVPTVHVPAVEVRAWRSLIEYRQRVLGERTRVKNRLRCLLRSHGLVAPRGLWTKAGVAWLAALSWPTAFEALQRDDLLDQLATLNARLKRLTRELDRRAQADPRVARLMTIPGVGPRTAEAFVAYVDELVRFKRAKQVASYFGLVPCQDASAQVNRLGHITRQGPGTMRKLLVEAAWQGIRHSPRLKAFYERIVHEDPDRRKIALLATAHHLVRVMVALWREETTWREEAPRQAA